MERDQEIQYLEINPNNYVQDIFLLGKKVFESFYPRDKFVSRLNERECFAYVAFARNKMVGFKIFYGDFEGQIYDWLDGVNPSFRRQGVSSNLMNMLIKFSKDNGYSKIKLKTHEGHPEMISLCNKFGFNEVGRDPNHWKDNLRREAIFFELMLENGQ